MECSTANVSANKKTSIRIGEPRENVRLEVYYSNRRQMVMSDYTINISTGGIFLETENILPVDSPLFVEFTLPVDDKHIKCSSRVAWTNEPENRKTWALPTGMGLQFVDLSLDDVKVIRHYIKEGGLEANW